MLHYINLIIYIILQVIYIVSYILDWVLPIYVCMYMSNDITFHYNKNKLYTVHTPITLIYRYVYITYCIQNYFKMCIQYMHYIQLNLH